MLFDSTKKQHALETCFCLTDYMEAARNALPPDIAAYLFGGAADEISIAKAHKDFEALELKPRVLRQIKALSPTVDVFGRQSAAPILVAPMSSQKLFHAEGENGMAMAASAMGLPMVVSCTASQTLETIAAAAEGGAQWFQLYFLTQRDHTLDLVRRAERANYAALVVGVDAQVSGVRTSLMRSGFVLPSQVRHESLLPYGQCLPVKVGVGAEGVRSLLTSAPTWHDIEWLKTQTSLPLLLKGVLHEEDARKAKELGVDGLILSNHGGRTLDTAISGLTALLKVRQAVGPEFALFIDGGVRRGTDVLKALALGAHGVLVGRPFLSALGVAGARGAAHAMQILIEEFCVAMVLSGCQTVADIPQADLLELVGPQPHGYLSK